MQEGIQFVCAQLPSGKKESENSSGCPLKIQKRRIGFLRRQEAVAWEKQRESKFLYSGILIFLKIKNNRILSNFKISVWADKKIQTRGFLNCANLLL